MAKLRHVGVWIALGIVGWAPRLSAAGGTSTQPFSNASEPAPLLLISLDGFRWDYCDKYADQTPNLRRLRHEGAYAHSLISVFPSNTFADHYTIVTGLWPEHHGIINNIMYDPKT